MEIWVDDGRPGSTSTVQFMTVIETTMPFNGLAGTVRDLAPRLANRDAADADRHPADNIADLVSAGVIRAPFPAAVGGAGCTLLDAVDAVEVIASASPSTALLAAMPIGLAGVYAVGRGAAPPACRGGWAELIERDSTDYRSGVRYAARDSE